MWPVVFFWGFIGVVAIGLFLMEWLEAGEEWWIALLESVGFLVAVGVIVAALVWAFNVGGA